MISAYLTIGYFIRGEEVEAPDLTARKVTEALGILRELKLTLALDREESSETLVAGEILSQYPRAGMRVKRGTPIRVVVSRGPRLVEAPEVVGLNEREAGIVLRRAQLEVGSVSYLPTANQPGEVVLAMDPPGGAGVAPGAAVNLLVSSPAGPAKFFMPDLFGMTLEAAAGELGRYGLRVGATATMAREGLAPGVVHGQRPEAGTPVGAGGEVELTLTPG
jgi:serine/threonine-protein kinase